MRSISLQTVRRTLIRHDREIGQFYVAHDRPVPRAVCRVVQQRHTHGLAISDLAILDDGMESAKSLLDSVLNQARQSDNTEVTVWLHEDADRLSDIVVSFGFAIRRLIYRMSVWLDYDMEHDETDTMIATPIEIDKTTDIPSFSQVSLCGSPQLVELLDGWRPRGSVTLTPGRPADRIMIYTSSKNRILARLQMAPPDSSGACRSSVTAQTLKSVLRRLYIMGIRDISVEVCAERDIKRVLREVGFEMNCTYMEFVLEML